MQPPVVRRARASVMAVDPFASPVFDTAAKVAEPVAARPLDLEFFVTLFAGYAVLMALLNGWEYFIVPKLQDVGLLPQVPNSLQAVRKAKEEIFAIPWKTPLTVDRSVTLPTLEELQQNAYRVGSSVTESGIRVAQFIRAHAEDAADLAASSTVLMELAASEKQPEPQLVPIKARFEGSTSISNELGVCTLSEEFTKFYGHRVYICKREDN